ncbi:MAG TPA: TlyA family RNA methyltransferase [Desulfosalsimonadaceae bacterium]|nr:TlyA family RNA methyltransferase [Desulfosalsimonadaceae bacterium]
MTKSRKKRLDILVAEQGLAPSREAARSLIMSGNILVDDTPVDKPGASISEDARIVNRKPPMPYVSRGGFKLAHALTELSMDVAGFVCLDVGASTGGFTDCLLQAGAERVYAVDVGYGQLDWRLRRDSRVTVIERTNIRYAGADILPETFDLIVVDVSFISLKIVVPAVEPFLRPAKGVIIALVKPQFEVGRGQVGKGGVVRDESLHARVLEDLTVFFAECGLRRQAALSSPILGPRGNREFLLCLVRNPAG